MYATNYLEGLALNAARGQSQAAPQAIYMGLYLSNPGESGTAGTEVAYEGYARQAVTFSSPAPMGTGLGVQNTGDIHFPTSPTFVGAVAYVGILDSLTGGNMLLYAPFVEPMTVNAGENIMLVAGEAQFWVAGTFSAAFRRRILNLLRGSSLVGAQPYLALFDGNPESGGAELFGGGYERLPVDFTAPAEQESGQMMIRNAQALSMARATDRWGVWSFTAVMDAASGGEPLICVAKEPSVEIIKGFRASIGVGNLSMAMT